MYNSPAMARPSTMLSLYLESESRRWAAQQRHSYPAPSSSPSDSHSSFSDYEESDNESIFSRGGGSRRSSVSSVASDEEDAPVAFVQPRDFNGAPITMYTSLEQAVAQSTRLVEEQGPRRLVTPGKLYENEEDDDEIVEMDEKQDDSVTTTHHHESVVAGGGIAAAG
ncbi:hypothetical protein GGR54DRAFT_593252 [Hypoxylon sp. NC1633]|nr:hypothetical protein GGR54DRAFT_593252 [Hypoxylon sp. NC1633]